MAACPSARTSPVKESTYARVGLVKWMDDEAFIVHVYDSTLSVFVRPNAEQFQCVISLWAG